MKTQNEWKVGDRCFDSLFGHGTIQSFHVVGTIECAEILFDTGGIATITRPLTKIYTASVKPEVPPSRDLESEVASVFMNSEPSEQELQEEMEDFDSTCFNEDRDLLSGLLHNGEWGEINDADYFSINEDSDTDAEEIVEEAPESTELEGKWMD